MHILDRKTAPHFRTVDKIKIIEADARKLDNGIPVYVIDKGTQDLVKIEFLFKAGVWQEPKRLISSAVNSMLNEGTSLHTSAQIADEIDYYGAFFQTENGSDWSSATLFTLTKYLSQTLPFVKEIFTQAIFPEKELQTYIQNKKQHLIVDIGRIDFVARKKFNESLFGNSHPYGYYAVADDFDKITREDLKQFYKQYYNSDNCTIIASGKVTQETFSTLNDFFGGNDWKGESAIPVMSHIPSTVNEKEILILKEDSIQSSIRIGKLLFNKLHPDYMGMQVLNTVFGGYFGSRLMANIREDKGYTYGIGSAVASNLHDGYFFITTDVGVSVCKNAINEIRFELQKLRTELIPIEELELVRNYILGTFLRGIDGPFALSDKAKSIITYGLGYDYYQKFINTIQTITPEELKGLANKYLHEDSMIELVVGKK